MTLAPATTNRLRPWLRRLLVLTWLSAFVATHLPAGNVPDVHVGDKTLHVVGYFVLASLLLATLITRGVGPICRVAMTVVALAAYGAIDEATQPFVRRHASFDDWLANLAGVLAAVIVCELVVALLGRRTRRRKSSPE